MLWHIQIEPAPGHRDANGGRLALEAIETGLVGPWSIGASRGFLVEGEISRAELDQSARMALVDPVVEVHTIHDGHTSWNGPGTVVHIMPKPGVTDPEAENALALLRSFGYQVANVRTIRTYRVEGPADSISRLVARVLFNDAVELAVVGALKVEQLGQGQPYRFQRIEVPLRGAPSQNSWT